MSLVCATIYYRVPKMGSDQSISSFDSQYFSNARKPIFLLNNIYPSIYLKISFQRAQTGWKKFTR